MVTVEVYDCKFHKTGSTYICKNKDCPVKECWCNGYSILKIICPFFEKTGDPYRTVLDDKQEIKSIHKNFLNSIKKRLKENLKNNQKTIQMCEFEIKKIMNTFDKIKQKSLTTEIKIVKK